MAGLTNLVSFSCSGKTYVSFSGRNVFLPVVEIFLCSLLLIFSVQLESHEGRWGKTEATNTAIYGLLGKLAI